jgi:rubredoxin
MSHVPQPPKQYVCLNCNSVYAESNPTGHSQTVSHDPPAECAACGAHEFTEIA